MVAKSYRYIREREKTSVPGHSMLRLSAACLILRWLGFNVRLIGFVFVVDKVSVEQAFLRIFRNLLSVSLHIFSSITGRIKSMRLTASLNNRNTHGSNIWTMYIQWTLSWLLTLRNKVFIEKLTLHQLVEKSPEFQRTQKVHSRVYKSPPHISILSNSSQNSRYAAGRLLGLRVRIPPRAWMFFPRISCEL